MKNVKKVKKTFFFVIIIFTLYNSYVILISERGNKNENKW